MVLLLLSNIFPHLLQLVIWDQGLCVLSAFDLEAKGGLVERTRKTNVAYLIFLPQKSDITHVEFLEVTLADQKVTYL